LKFSQDVLNEVRIAAKLGRDKDLQGAIEKALGEINDKRHWKKEVGEWISVTDSYWNVTKVYKELQAVTKNDMGAIRKAIHDYKVEEVIEPWKTRGEGWYRRKEKELIDIDWKNADEKPLEIKLPLGLDKMVNLYSGDIFVIAGESNAGKSAMCLNIVELNMDDWDCHYWASQDGGPKLRKRISFLDTPQELWKMPAHDRRDNYNDVLIPNAINIIDFMIQTENFWEVGTKIRDVHFALRDLEGSIAVIALQKSEYKKYGTGGDQATAQLASLYITLSKSGKAKIIKLKDSKTESDPNSKICDFEIINAAYFDQRTPWHYEEDEKVFTPRKY